MADTSTASQLPDFEVSRFHMDDERGSYDMLKVVCPRCRREFWVEPGSWATLHPVKGRSDLPPAYPFGRNCPYGGCTATSAIPEELRIMPIPTEEPASKNISGQVPPGRMVVRRRSGLANSRRSG